ETDVEAWCEVSHDPPSRADGRPGRAAPDSDGTPRFATRSRLARPGRGAVSRHDRADGGAARRMRGHRHGVPFRLLFGRGESPDHGQPAERRARAGLSDAGTPGRPPPTPLPVPLATRPLPHVAAPPNLGRVQPTSLRSGEDP